MTKVKNTNSSWLNEIRVGFFVALLLFPIFSYGQEKQLDGKIENEKDVEGVHVLNTSSRFNSITNSIGEFYITVKPNDTLLVSSISYVPRQIVITEEIYTAGYLSITLENLVNELDEVLLGPRLTGNLERDIKNIKVKDQINFDDVGIPGFKGKPEEKIVPIVPGVGLLTAVDLEAMYKHLSGYYKKLRLKRKWEGENVLVSHMIHGYSPSFFKEAYGIPEDRLVDFLLFCIETSEIQQHYKDENFGLVLEVFKTKGEEYVQRIPKKEE